MGTILFWFDWRKKNTVAGTEGTEAIPGCLHKDWSLTFANDGNLPNFLLFFLHLDVWFERFFFLGHFVACELQTSSVDVCEIGRHVDMLGIWVLMEDWIHFMPFNANKHDHPISASKNNSSTSLTWSKRFQKKLFIQTQLTTANCEWHKMSQVFFNMYIYIYIYILI